MASRVAHMNQHGSAPVSGDRSDTTFSFHSNNTNNHHQYHQQAAKMSGQISEKRMQELRALAYEYVKQIVCKANELSQATAAAAAANNGPPPSSSSSHSGSQMTGGAGRGQEVNNRLAHNSLIENQSAAHTRRLVGEAAVQINERFRLPDAVGPSAHAPRVGGDQSKSSKSVTYRHNNPIYQVDTPPSGGAQITPIETKTTAPITCASEVPTRTLNDYIERDYATMSSSQDENDSSRGLAFGRTDNQTTTTAGARSRAGGRGASKSRLHQCLNWHLLVSCFSTCLPEALTRHTRANMGPSAV